MTHIAITLFFVTILAGAGVALQLTVLGNWRVIAAGLRAERLSAPRFTVTLRPQAAGGFARRRQGAAA